MVRVMGMGFLVGWIDMRREVGIERGWNRRGIGIGIGIGIGGGVDVGTLNR